MSLQIPEWISCHSALLRALLLGCLMGLGSLRIESFGLFLFWLPFFTFACHPRISFLQIFIFCYAYFQVAFYWIYLSVTWVQSPVWAHGAMAVLPALGYGLVGAGLAVIMPWRHLQSLAGRVCGGAIWWVLIAKLWGVAGLPWMTVSDLWGACSLPIAQVASVVGKDWLDLILMILMVTTLYGLWRRNLLVGILSLLCLSSMYFWGVGRLERCPVKMSDVFVRVLHTCVDLESRKPRIMEPAACQLLYVAYSDDERIQATLLPESFFSLPLDLYPKCMRYIDMHCNHHIFAGGTAYASEGLYNSILKIDACESDREIYHKRRLVPFGEYIPFREYFSEKIVSGIAQGGVSFACGSKSPLHVCRLGCSCALPPFWSCVCYEGVMAHSDLDKRARWIMQLSNECWFYDSAEREQHWAILRLRSIEVGRPLVRATNWGVSGCVDSCGRDIACYTGPTRFFKQAIPIVWIEETVWLRYAELWSTLYWMSVIIYVAVLWFCVRRRRVLGSS